MAKILPFEVDQLVEARSNMNGFRGAWFRCKIKRITGKKLKEMRISLEYYDFPDEDIENIKLYQKAPSTSNKSKRTHIMVRPCFPPIYSEKQLPEISTISELVVVVNNGWKVGDMVDWRTDNCYWTGTITEVLEDEKIKIELLPPPFGEGSCYEASSSDLRPALDWSLENGWTLPRAVNGEDRQHCARLVIPANQDTVPGSHAITESVHAEDDTLHTGRLPKKMRRDDLPCSSSAGGTLETTIVDLEELVNKVYWLKSILDFGMPVSRSSWEFSEHGAPKEK